EQARALKAAERALRRANKELRGVRRKINEYEQARPDVDREGHARHSGSNGRVVGEDQSQASVVGTGAAGNGMRVENSGHAEGGDDGTPPSPQAHPAAESAPRDSSDHNATVDDLASA